MIGHIDGKLSEQNGWHWVRAIALGRFWQMTTLELARRERDVADDRAGFGVAQNIGARNVVTLIAPAMAAEPMIERGTAAIE